MQVLTHYTMSWFHRAVIKQFPNQIFAKIPNWTFCNLYAC